MTGQDSRAAGAASPFRKLERAELHFQVLQSELSAFHNSDPLSVRLERHSEPPEQIDYCWVVERLDTLPPHWPVIVGDLVQNLRAALDHAAWLAVIKAKGEKFATRNARDINFPIYRTRRNDLGKVVAFAPRIKSLVESIQPYIRDEEHPDREPLWVIHQLSNIDKHRSLHVVALIASEARVDTKPPLKSGEFSLIEKGPLQAGAVVARFMAASRSEVRVDAEFAIEVAVEATARAPRVPLQIGLRQLVDTTRAIVGDMEQYW